MNYPSLGHDSNNTPYAYLVKINGNHGYGGSHDEAGAIKIFNLRVTQRPAADTITLHRGTSSESIQKQMGTGKNGAKAAVSAK